MKIKDIVLCAIFASLIAIGSLIRFPIFMVPFTMQVFFVMLTAVILGSKLGFITIIIYILMGLIGIPVFSEGGGIAYILKPTFGYILGFALSTIITGKIVHKYRVYTFKNIFIASLIGLIFIYAIGVVYYYLINILYLKINISVRDLFLFCFLITLPTDIISCIIVSIIAKKILPLIKNNMI